MPFSSISRANIVQNQREMYEEGGNHGLYQIVRRVYSVEFKTLSGMDENSTTNLFVNIPDSCSILLNNHH